ncbi:MAG TPA: MaoC family dehydratase [Bauldia sp.]|nr:MaoC family dehydratase [Bauldia sp.]
MSTAATGTGDSIRTFPVGKSVTFAKTVSESDVYLFAGITGDFDPIHVNEEYARTTQYGQRIAHGALTLGYMSTASTLIHQGFGRPLVSLGYDRIRIVAPVFIGDTLTVTYTVVATDIEKSRTTAEVVVTNQRGETVVVANHIQKVL